MTFIEQERPDRCFRRKCEKIPSPLRSIWHKIPFVIDPGFRAVAAGYDKDWIEGKKKLRVDCQYNLLRRQTTVAVW
jgi:hypothetical protein